MNRWMLCLLLSLGGYGVAHAAGDASVGKTRVAVCGACHGPDGNSLVPIFPKLAGQGERYLLEQLQAIQSGRRPVPEMTGQLDGLSAQALADIAAFYAGQTAGPTAGTAEPGLVVQGQALYHGGRLTGGLPACSACHGPAGEGLATAGFPHLGGQQAAYTRKQLNLFRTGGRTTDGDAMIMRTIAAKLDDQDIAALAAYIQSLGQP